VSAGRILALDVGTKTIGVAVTDPLRMFGQPVCTIRRQGVRKDVDQICPLIASHDVVDIVVGLPLELDGTEERSARLARQIGEALDAATECAVHYMDERFSSVEAEQKLIEMNVSRKRRKEVVDQVAAIVILERYLNSMQRGSGER